MPTLPVRKGAIRLRTANRAHFVLLFIPVIIAGLGFQRPVELISAVEIGMLVVAGIVTVVIIESYFHRFEVNASRIRRISWFGQVESELAWSDVDGYSEKGGELVLSAGRKQIVFDRHTTNWAALDHLIRHHTGLSPSLKNCSPGLGKPVDKRRNIFNHGIPIGIFLTIWGSGWTWGWMAADTSREPPLLTPSLSVFGILVLLLGLHLSTEWLRMTPAGLDRVRLGIVQEHIPWEEIDSMCLESGPRRSASLIIWSGTRFMTTATSLSTGRALMQELSVHASPDARIYH